MSFDPRDRMHNRMMRALLGEPVQHPALQAFLDNMDDDGLYNNAKAAILFEDDPGRKATTMHSRAFHKAIKTITLEDYDTREIPLPLFKIMCLSYAFIVREEITEQISREWENEFAQQFEMMSSTGMNDEDGRTNYMAKVLHDLSLVDLQSSEAQLQVHFLRCLSDDCCEVMYRLQNMLTVQQTISNLKNTVVDLQKQNTAMKRYIQLAEQQVFYTPPPAIQRTAFSGRFVSGGTLPGTFPQGPATGKRMRSGSTTSRSSASSGVSAPLDAGLRPDDSVSQAGRDNSDVGTEYSQNFEAGSSAASGVRMDE
jgi:hypothetical protein